MNNSISPAAHHFRWTALSLTLIVALTTPFLASCKRSLSDAKPADVDKFEDEMRATKVDWQFVSYGGAVHGFSNPKNKDPEHGLMYDEKVDQRSWKAMQDFFDEIFAKK